MKNMLIVAGTRPEVIKLFPVKEALENLTDVKVTWLSTGQHTEMLLPFFRMFNFEPDIQLSLPKENRNLASTTAQILEECTSCFEKLQPECVIVQGDTTSAMAGALAAYYLKIPVAHVEAGLRSGNKYSPFPEEVNRKIISSLASFHFAPTQRAYDQLLKEQVDGQVFVTGNTVIDVLLKMDGELESERLNVDQEIKKVTTSYSRFVLITGHRRENFGEGLENICNALRTLAEGHPDIGFIYPVHLNPNVSDPVHDLLDNISNIHLIAPVDYITMVYLMRQCFMIITDSGGLQEEGPSFGKPILVTRNTTERPEGIDQGVAVLVGTDQNVISQTAIKCIEDSDYYNSFSRKDNPYGKGDSARQIASILNKWLS